MPTVPTVVQRAGRLDIEVEQYAGLRVQILVKDKVTGDPIDLSGYAFKMEIRESVTGETVLLTLSNANGRVDLVDPVNGRIDLVFSSADTALFEGDGYVYDLLGIPSGEEPTRILRGAIVPIPGSTVYP